MVVEEQGVHRLAAGNGRGVDDRDVLRGGLGAGQPARLGEEHVTGIHEIRNLVSETERDHIVVVAEILLQPLAQLGIVSTDENDLNAVAALAEDFLDSVLNVPEAHASGHKEKPFLVRVHVAVVKYALSPRLAPVLGRLMKDRPHRDSIRVQFFSRKALLDAFLDEVLVRHDVVVQFGVLHERDAGVVGHDEDGLGRELALALEGGYGLRRENVDADHDVKSVLFDVVVKTVAVESVGIIDRRLGRLESVADNSPGAVGHREELGAGGEEVYFRRTFLRLGAHESHGVLNLSLNSL